MESFGKIQSDLNGIITKARSNFKKSPKERLTVSYIETRLESLENTWATFLKTHHQIISETKEVDYTNSVYYTKGLYESTEELYIEYKSELKESLRMMTKAIANTQQSHSDKEQSNACYNVKLPKIELPKFSGRYSEWVTFRDLFQSLVHNNRQLDDVQRLQFLKSHLTGEADQLLRHIPITADNYSRCWGHLEKRYNNKRYLSNCILKRLMNQKMVSADSSQCLKELLDTTNECLHALGNIGIDITNWDVIVIFVVTQRLDMDSRKQWELYISEFTNEIPNLKQFNEFLETRYRALEFINPKFVKSSNSNVKSLHVDNKRTDSNACHYCSEEHKLSNCKGFAKLDVDARRGFVQSRSLCFNCLGQNHPVYLCRQKTRCQVCQKKHNTMLHKSPLHQPGDGDSDAKVKGNPIENKRVSASQHSENSKICGHQRTEQGQVLLATALVNVQSSNKTALVLRSLLDQGSQASFITESAVQRLRLKKIPHKGIVSGIGGDKSTLVSKAMVIIEVQSRRDSTVVMTVNAYVLRNLTGSLPESNIVRKMPAPLPTTELADPSFNVANKIDLLLGAEVYGQILLNGVIRGPPGTPIAQNTKLGWILSGHITSQVSCSGNGHSLAMHGQCSNENDLLKKFWELEASPESNIRLTADEQRCEEIFSRTIKRDEKGRFEVKLPFKTSNTKCRDENSRDIARRQFLSLEKRLARDPELLKEYASVIKEYFSLGHM